MSKPQSRYALEGIQRVSFEPIGKNYEFTTFSACLKSALSFLGAPYSYEYIMATSGAAYRLMWHSKRWEGGNIDILNMAENQIEPIKRAFEAVGYSYEMILNKDWKVDLEMIKHLKLKKEKSSVLQSKIIENIYDRGTPVLGFGVIGPPECCIITGYDNDGGTLIGWNFFQEVQEFNEGVEFESAGYFRKTGWIKDTLGMILIGNEQERLPIDDIYRSCLEWALEVIRKPKVHDFHNGLSSYSIWAEKLGQDEEFPQDDLKILSERKIVHYDAMTMVAERANAAKFIRQIVEQVSFLNAKEDLLSAADCFDEEVSQMKKWWKIVGEIWNDEQAQINKLAEPDIRKNFIPCILEARNKDEEAANLIEKALSKLS